MVPLIVVSLEFGQQSSRRVEESATHVQLISPDIANKITKTPKQAKLGINAAISRNFPNSTDVQALSRYLPP
jgi:hypothetical protein